MQSIRNFDSVIDTLKNASRRVRVVVVCPYDEHTCQAIEQAIDLGLAQFILVGEPARIGIALQPSVEIVEAAGDDAAAALAVEYARTGRADVLMKGLVNTENYLKAILNKEQGILPHGNVLSHVTVAEIPGFDRLLTFGDVAVIPFPTAEQHAAIVGNVVKICRLLGAEQPYVALLHCNEKTTPKFPVTVAYQAIKEAAAAGGYGVAVVDGPMDVKTALDAESGAIKGIQSPVCGKANGLVFPDIEAGNVFYKTISWLGHSLNAGMLMGASVPVVLPSRSDSTRSKLCSLALACLSAMK